MMSKVVIVNDLLNSYLRKMNTSEIFQVINDKKIFLRIGE